MRDPLRRSNNVAGANAAAASAAPHGDDVDVDKGEN